MPNSSKTPRANHTLSRSSAEVARVLQGERYAWLRKPPSGAPTPKVVGVHLQFIPPTKKNKATDVLSVIAIAFDQEVPDVFEMLVIGDAVQALVASEILAILTSVKVTTVVANGNALVGWLRCQAKAMKVKPATIEQSHWRNVVDRSTLRSIADAPNPFGAKVKDKLATLPGAWRAPFLSRVLLNYTAAEATALVSAGVARNASSLGNKHSPTTTTSQQPTTVALPRLRNRPQRRAVPPQPPSWCSATCPSKTSWLSRPSPCCPPATKLPPRWPT